MKVAGKVLFFLILMSLLYSTVLFPAYPDKPIYLIVPWAAGGITDKVSRVLAPLLERYLGKPVIVVNKAGASGVIGTDFVYSKSADGYNVLFSAETPGTFRVMGLSDLTFRDFDPIAMIIEDTNVVVVHKNSPYKTMQDLVNDIRARPLKVKMSYSGPGASGHIQGLLLLKANLRPSMTPFGGGSPAMLAVLSGQVDFTFGNIGTVLDYIRSGDLRALSVYNTVEDAALPGVPPITDTILELKPYLPLTYPNCILVKKGTSEEVIRVWSNAVEKAVQQPEWIAFLQANFYRDMSSIQGEAVLEYWDKWTSIVAWLLYDAGVTKHSPEEFNISR